MFRVGRVSRGKKIIQAVTSHPVVVYRMKCRRVYRRSTSVHQLETSNIGVTSVYRPRNKILLYGSETWSLRAAARRLSASENRRLRDIADVVYK